jgi:hypothetical protein
MMFNQKTVLGLVVAAAAFAPSAFGQGTGVVLVQTGDDGINVNDLVEELIGDSNVLLRNAKLTGGSRGSNFATFQDLNTPTTFGIPRGIILSTGTVNNVLGPANNKTDQGRNNFLDGDDDIDRLFNGGGTKIV